MEVPKTILIVDDYADCRLLLKSYIEPLGVQCIEACDGQQAITLTRFYQPALILSDTDMPHVSGIELFHWVSQHHPHIPFILFYSFSGRHFDTEVKTLGVYQLFSKPYNFKVISEAVRTVLNKKKPLT